MSNPEFDRIARYFAPLASHAGAFSLRDDAACITPPEGQDLVFTKDMIAQQIHFIGDESPALIAQKLLRTNLSDLAAKGALPLGYLLGCAVARGTKDDFFAEFARGLAEDQARYGITLLGGDTIATEYAPVFSVTAIGTVPQGQMIRRRGAQVNDVLYVSGTIGDAALGLQLLQRTHDDTHDAHHAFLVERYHLPQPRTWLGPLLRPMAHAMMDISDGLMQDLGHLCRASGVGAQIYWDKIPLSPAARTRSAEHAFMETILSGGDDYELLFTAAPESHSALQAMAKTSGIAITAIGEITADTAVHILDQHYQAISVPIKGFQHV